MSSSSPPSPSVALPALLLGALVLMAAGCPGPRGTGEPSRAPASARAAPVDDYARFQLSATGLGFRVSDADATEGARAARDDAPLAEATALREGEAKALLARMPPLAKHDDDLAPRFQAKALPRPQTSKVVLEPFPPKAAPPPAPAAPHASVLRVERHAPMGAVDVAPALSVTFSEPMVPLSSLAELALARPPARLTPEPPGSWRWLSPETLVFQPKERFPKATEYFVEIPAGTRSANGATLTATERWSFTTPAPSLRTTWPRGGGAPLEPVLFAELDQRLEPDALLASLSLAPKAGGAPLPLRLATPGELDASERAHGLAAGAEKGRFIAFRATHALTPDTDYQVTLAAGAPSAEGPRRTDKPQGFAFKTYERFAVTEHGCGWRGEACTPLDPFVLELSNPIDEARFSPAMVKVDPPLAQLKIEAGHRTLWVSGKSRGKTRYTVTLDAALADEHGQTLGKETAVAFDVGHAAPALFDEGPDTRILEPAAPRALDVYSINEPRLRVRVLAVKPRDLPAFAEATSAAWRGETPPKLPGRLVVDRVLTTRTAPDEIVRTAIDLSPALAKGEDMLVGDALVVVEPARAPPRTKRWKPLLRWVQSTALGLVTHRDHGQVLAWVTRLADGAPVGDAEVAVTDGPSARTGADGLARVSLGARGGAGLTVRKGADVSFATDSFGGVDYQRGSRESPLRIFAFDDRGLYRPGEEVHVKGWVRRIVAGGDVAREPALVGRKVDWDASTDQGDLLASGGTTLDERGAFDLRFTLPKRATLGAAHVGFRLPGWREPLDGDALELQLAEFRRPDFDVSTDVSAGPHFVGGHATVSARASYLAGGGLPSAKTHWDIGRRTTTFTPPGRAAFHFGPEDSRPPPSYEDPLPNERSAEWAGKTDLKGVHALRVDLDALEPAYPMTLTFNAAVADVNRQELIATSRVLVHPSDVYVGLRAERGFVRAGEQLGVELVATDLDGASVAGRHVSVRSARLEWQRSGDKWTEKELEPRTCERDSEREPVRCAFTTGEAGEYRVTALVTDAYGRKNQSAMDVWVESENATRDPRIEESKLELVPSKASYAPGETAELLVVSSFAPAEGLLTLRRDGLVYTQRFSAKGPMTALRVPLDAAWLPGVTAHVELVGARAREGEPKLPRQPAFASGQATLPISTAARRLEVEISARAKVASPGDDDEVTVLVRDAAGEPVADASVTVLAADEAVLGLAGKKLPDPLAAFYAMRQEGVTDVGSRKDVTLGVDLASLSPLVAEDEERPRPRASPGKHPGVIQISEVTITGKEQLRLRDDFTPLALYAPRVVTDAAGRARVPMKLPGNLTRYRLVAVAAAGENLFGSGEATVTARLPLSVRVSAPRFLSVGDRFELPVVVQNLSDAPLDVGVAARADNATFVGASANRVHIAPNSRTLVRFPVTTARPGSARFQIGVASGALSDAAEVSLPVYAPETTEAFAAYGTLDLGATSRPLRVPTDVMKEVGGLSLSTSSTAVSALTDAVLYLTRYPFDGNEQLASRVLAVSCLRDVLAAFRADGLPAPDALERLVALDLGRLTERQSAAGGWPAWSGADSPFVSVHVAHALARAKEKGMKPDATTLSRALSYLQQMDKHVPATWSPDARRALVSYALYVRRRLGDADPARARRLIADAGGVDAMPAEALGWLWPTLSADPASQAELVAVRRWVRVHATETAGDAHFASGYADSDYLLMRSDRRVDALMLEGLIADEPQSTLIPKLVRGLLSHRTAGRWSGTQESAHVLVALERYFATYEQATPDFVARVWLGDAALAEQPFRGRTTETHATFVPLSWLSEHGGEVTLAKDGPGRLYYRLAMSYAPREPTQGPLDRGFAVSRTYEGAEHADDVRRDADGTWRIKAGSKVRVRLVMVARSRRVHVALIDPLPAGLEAMSPTLTATGSIPPDPRDPTGDAAWWGAGAWFEHQNLRDERAEAFATLLPEGVWDYTYVARATTPGTFIAQPAKAEELYAPETFGRSASERVVVE